MTDSNKKLTAIRTPLTKAQLFASIAEDSGLTNKQVVAVFESLGDHMHRHLKKRSTGTFTLPGLAKITVQSKKATRARPGRNPFTGEEIMIAAKPARRVVRVRPLKALKDMAES